MTTEEIGECLELINAIEDNDQIQNPTDELYHPVNIDAIYHVKSLLFDLPSNIPKPYICARYFGDIALGWTGMYGKHFDVSINADGDRRGFLYTQDRSWPECRTDEMMFGMELEQIISCIRWAMQTGMKPNRNLRKPQEDKMKGAH